MNRLAYAVAIAALLGVLGAAERWRGEIVQTHQDAVASAVGFANQSMAVYDRQRTWRLTREEEAGLSPRLGAVHGGHGTTGHADLLAAGIAARAETEPLAACQTVILAALDRWLAEEA